MMFFQKIVLAICLVLFSSCIGKNQDNLIMDPAFLFMMYENLVYQNYCPPKNATLDSGMYTITLNTGEEYWFDVTAPRSYKSIDIGISKSTSEQTFTFFNDDCSYNFTITKQRKTFTADQEKKVRSVDNEFSYYSFYFRPTPTNSYIGAIKIASGSGEIKIKIP